MRPGEADPGLIFGILESKTADIANGAMTTRKEGNYDCAEGALLGLCPSNQRSMQVKK